ncbi:unnamed protein product [Cylicostephanus goldi]|uniref:7TM GPCR serpentine receptor class x (Srx) domain-containing protein n=1 Tax=Cylicostephanus goldi TaxID=71465 RepID=A0A3P6R675_CYLGO|nr:unnamed protein product [Cylicostephanus goldi]
MVVNSLTQLFDLVGVVLLGLNSSGASSASMLVDLIISYFSTVLMFFLGLNRYAAFSAPRLYETIMNLKTIRLILVGSLAGSVVISFVIFYASGCERVFEGDKMVDYVEDTAYIQVGYYVRRSRGAILREVTNSKATAQQNDNCGISFHRSPSPD